MARYFSNLILWERFLEHLERRPRFACGRRKKISLAFSAEAQSPLN